MDEALVIEGCRKGQTRAQKMLFDHFAEGMLAVCTRYVKNSADAEELMLNGFLKFFEHIGKYIFNGPGSVAPWLKKIMINECLMFLRRKGQLILTNERVAEDVYLEAQAIDKLSATELFRYITELPAGYRTVFNLYVIEEMTHREIAVLLGISEGTSKSQLNKARIQLQDKIKKSGSYDERFRQ